MRTFETFVALGIVALTVGCGGGSSGGFTSPSGRTASSGGGVCKAQSCAAQDSYYSCVSSKCGTEAKTCFGDSYASGTFGGACQGYATCNMACPCDANGEACIAGCYLAATPDCQTCLGTITACASSTTAACGQTPTCPATTNTSTTTLTSTSTATGASCTALQSCCTTLAAAGGAAGIQACQAAFVGLLESECAPVLAQYRTAGTCK